MYTTINFPTKKALKEAIARGEEVTLYAPGLGSPTTDGIEFIEGPHYPASHSWYAQVKMEKGKVVRVIR